MESICVADTLMFAIVLVGCMKAKRSNSRIGRKENHMPIVEYPELEAYRDRGFKGLWVKGCVERGEGSNVRYSAHTHKDGEFNGWICVKGHSRLRRPDGKPTLLIWHELAHILSGSGHWHDKVWQNNMRNLCGRVDRKRKVTGGRLER